MKRHCPKIIPPNAERFATLTATYKTDCNVLSWKELAQREDEIIKAAPLTHEQGKATPRNPFLWLECYIPRKWKPFDEVYAFSFRQDLYQAPWRDAADPVWKALDGGMRITVAQEILAEVRRRVPEGIPMAQYRELFQQQVTEKWDGNPQPKEPKTPKEPKEPKAARTKKRKHEKISKVSGRDMLRDTFTTFLVAVLAGEFPDIARKHRELVNEQTQPGFRQFVQAILGDTVVPEVVMQKHYQWMCGSFDDLVTEWGHDLRRLVRRYEGGTSASLLAVSEKVRAACKEFGLRAPRTGYEPVNLVLANTLRKQQVRDIHPDKHELEGPEAVRRANSRVSRLNEHYAALQEHNELITPQPTAPEET